MQQENNFDNFINTLTDSIKTFDYYVDWNKVESNVKKIEKILNILNYLIGKDNFKKEFEELLNEYPEIVTVFPIILAIREKREIIIEEITLKQIEYKFDKPFIITPELAEKYYLFVQQSGLEDLLKSKKIKNLVDYVFGIEVGMDTNARKNRTGFQMERIVESKIKEFCSQNNNYDFMSQASKDKILTKWGYDLDIDKANRKFDFAVYNRSNKKLDLIEVNFYNGGGSKLKSTAGEYQYLYDFLYKQNINLIWITDGMGWQTAKKPLEETFIHNNKQILNLKMVTEGLLFNLLK